MSGLDLSQDHIKHSKLLHFFCHTLVGNQGSWPVGTSSVSFWLVIFPFAISLNGEAHDDEEEAPVMELPCGYGVVVGVRQGPNNM